MNDRVILYLTKHMSYYVSISKHTCINHISISERERERFYMNYTLNQKKNKKKKRMNLNNMKIRCLKKNRSIDLK